MRLEYQTRSKSGKYKKEQDIDNIYFQEDGSYAYMIIEMSDGSKRRFLLAAHPFLLNDA